MRQHDANLFEECRRYALAHGGDRLFDCICVHLPYDKILSTWQIEEELYGNGRYPSLGFELLLPAPIRKLLGQDTYRASFQQLVTCPYSHRHLLSHCKQQGLSAKVIGMIHVGNTYEFPDDANQHRFPMTGKEVLL